MANKFSIKEAVEVRVSSLITVDTTVLDYKQIQSLEADFESAGLEIRKDNFNRDKFTVQFDTKNKDAQIAVNDIVKRYSKGKDAPKFSYNNRAFFSVDTRELTRDAQNAAHFGFIAAGDSDKVITKESADGRFKKTLTRPFIHSFAYANCDDRTIDRLFQLDGNSKSSGSLSITRVMPDVTETGINFASNCIAVMYVFKKFVEKSPGVLIPIYELNLISLVKTENRFTIENIGPFQRSGSVAEYIKELDYERNWSSFQSLLSDLDLLVDFELKQSKKKIDEPVVEPETINASNPKATAQKSRKAKVVQTPSESTDSVPQEQAVDNPSEDSYRSQVEDFEKSIAEAKSESES